MNPKHRVRLSKLSLGLIVALAAAPAFAQSTSAGLNGVVTGPDGQVLSSSSSGPGANPEIYVVAYDQAGNRVESPRIRVSVVSGN